MKKTGMQQATPDWFENQQLPYKQSSSVTSIGQVFNSCPRFQSN